VEQVFQLAGPWSRLPTCSCLIPTAIRCPKSPRRHSPKRSSHGWRGNTTDERRDACLEVIADLPGRRLENDSQPYPELAATEIQTGEN
jgi:hypothetical protein